LVQSNKGCIFEVSTKTNQKTKDMNYLEQQQYIIELTNKRDHLISIGMIEASERVQETITRQYL
jgi:hypothetical protein